MKNYERKTKGTVADNQQILLTDQDAAYRYSIGVSKLRQESKAAGAVVKIGRAVRNNILILDRHFGISN